MEEETSLQPSTLPFFMSLRNPLTVSSAVHVKGYALENATTFYINFCAPITCCFCRRNNDKDVAFSFRPFFDRQCIVRNSTYKSNWAEEEVAENQDFPLSRGCNFFIEIFVVGRELLIAVNGLHFCTFSLKISPNCIDSIEINGDVKVESVSINFNQNVYPSATASSEQPSSNADHVVNVDGNTLDCRDIKLPLICVLSKTLECGNVIRIEGRVKMLPYSFSINLQNSELKRPHPSILLHINARYSYSQKKSRKNLLVFNSWLNSVWGIEKTLSNSCLPIPGSVFELTIICEQDHFRVCSDEEISLNFPYRSALQTVKVIYIQGDICIYSINVS